MITGRPRLVVWSLDDTLRLFELGESGAGQIWSQAIINTAQATTSNSFPYFDFSKDAYFLAVKRNSSVDMAMRESRSVATGVNIASIMNVHSSTNVSLNNTIAGYGRESGQFLVLSKTSMAVSSALTRFNSLGGDTGGASRQSFAGTRQCVAFSPDGQRTFIGRNVAGGSYAPTTSSNNYLDPSITGSLPHIDWPVHVAAWSPNSQYLATIDIAAPNDPVRVLIRDEALILAAYGEIPNPAGIGSPVSVAFSYDNRHVAVGYLNGSNYTTVIYSRFGAFFIEKQRFSAMGRLLNFTEDGLMLIDASAKKAILNTAGVFVEQVGFLDALPNNVRSQAISPHVEFITSTSRFYDDAMVDFVTGDVVLGDIKLVLLSGDATFDSSDATLDAVTNSGAYEVFGDGWDEGGVAIVNAALSVKSQQNVALVADNIEAIIYRNPIQFRYAVIVEGVKPRIWIDFNQTVNVQADQKLTFDLETLGIVNYAS